MKTHTIRNKSSNQPIMTIAKPFWDDMVKAHPEAVMLALSWFKHTYKQGTGKSIVLDYDQNIELKTALGFDDNGFYVSKISNASSQVYGIINAFRCGVLCQAPGTYTFEEVLKLSDNFYTMMEKNLDQFQNE